MRLFSISVYTVSRPKLFCVPQKEDTEIRAVTLSNLNCKLERSGSRGEDVVESGPDFYIWHPHLT